MDKARHCASPTTIRAGSEEESKARLDEVDRGLTQWGRTCTATFKTGSAGLAAALALGYTTHVWLRMKPSARRITRWILWITLAEIIVFLTIAVVFVIAQSVTRKSLTGETDFLNPDPVRFTGIHPSLARHGYAIVRLTRPKGCVPGSIGRSQRFKEEAMLYPNASLRVALIALVPTVLMGVPTNSPRAAGLDPFFSEYVEGSGNNKALEIYNPGMDAIDLAGFTVALYANGKTNPSTYSLTGLLAPGDVFVLGSSRGASAIQDVADQTWGSLNFNGDDAIALTRNGALLDVIGTIGADPGDFWGSASINTKDYTLVRMASVTQGDSDGSNPFDPALQWLAHGPDTFSGLGSHSINSVPIPASLPLLLSGLGIFWGARRRTPASAHIIQSA